MSVTLLVAAIACVFLLIGQNAPATEQPTEGGIYITENDSTLVSRSYYEAYAHLVLAGDPSCYSIQKRPEGYGYYIDLHWNDGCIHTTIQGHISVWSRASK